MGIFFTLFYQPIANVSFFFLTFLQTNSFAVAVIFLILFVKILLLRVSINAQRMQIKVRAISDELKKIREKITDKKKQAEKILELYRREGINPFSPLLPLILQIPIYIAIFFVVRDVGTKTFAPEEALYSFISFSGEPSLIFFGVDLAEKGNFLLALLVLLTQYYAIILTQKGMPVDPKTEGMQKMMRTGLPILVSTISLFFVAIVGFYWLINNLLSIVQDIIIKSMMQKKETTPTK